MDYPVLKTVSAPDYLVIAAYLATLVWIGKYFSGYNRNIQDFFKGGGKLPWWVGGISAFMAGFSAWIFTGGAGVVYENGLLGTLFLCTGILATFIAWLFFAKRWRRTRVTTMFEFVSARFNLPTQQVLSWAYLPINLFYCSAVLLSLSIFVTAALGIGDISTRALGLPLDFTLTGVQATILVAGAIILAYCYFGGLLAVTSCDVLSFLVIVPIAVLIVPLMVVKLGSVGKLFTTPAGFQVPAEQSIFGEPITFFFVLIWLTSGIHSYTTNPIVQRYWSVRDETQARKVALLCMWLFIFGVLVWSVPPLAVRHLFPDLTSLYGSLKAPAEGAYVSACLAVLPHGMIGVMFAAIFAASMSSIDSTLNFISGIFTNDIYRKVIRKDADERHLLRVGRLSTLVIGLTAMGLSLVMSGHGGAFSWMIRFDEIATTPIVVPLVLGLLFPRCGSMAAIITFFAGLSWNVTGVIFLQLEYKPVMLVSFILTYLTFISSAWLIRDRRDKAESIRRFFELLDTPVDPDRELGEAGIDRLSMLRFIGKLAAGTGTVICLMALIGQPLGDRLINLAGGAVVLALGWLMVRADRKIQAAKPPAAGN
ncbi:MAG: hypothetical protein JXQ83_09330 [Candidatus Glassbacteria bacterium]|nr:hypothetical protein [Candidatus Glassbacteria bacterium]